MFNLDDFKKNATSDAGSTSLTPLPPGEYNAILESYEMKQGISQKNGEPWLACNIVWNVQAPEVLQKLGREKVTVRQNVFLDTKDGKLDMSQGRNVQLNRVREALGQNVPGRAWGFDQLPGSVAKIKTKLVEGRNGQFADVEAVGKA